MVYEGRNYSRGQLPPTYRAYAFANVTGRGANRITVFVTANTY